MTGPSNEPPDLDEAHAAAQRLVGVLGQLAGVHDPADRPRLIAQWDLLAGQIDEARQRVERPGLA